MTPSLLGFSVEIIVLITLQLDLHAILVCKQCCHHLKSIIEDSAAVQYQIEQALTGYDFDAPLLGEPMSIAARRDALKRHREVWNTLDWTESLINDRGKKGRAERTCLSGGTYAFSRGRSITFLELASVTHGIPAREWQHDDVGINFFDFAFDRGLNILLLFEKVLGSFQDDDDHTLRVHLRSLLDLSPCPGVDQATLEFPDVPIPFDYCLARTQIEGDILAIILQSGEYTDLLDDEEDPPKVLVIWNYIKGRVLGTLTDDEDSKVTSFATINSTTVLVCQITRSMPIVACLHIYSINNTAQILTLTSCFKLPELTMGVIKASLSVVSSVPPPSNTPHTSWHTPHSSQNFPFHLSHKNRMVVLRWILLYNGHDDSESGHDDNSAFGPSAFQIFIHLQTFLNKASSPNTTSKTNEWHTWGPANTRILVEQYPTDDWDFPDWLSIGSRLVNWTVPLDSRWITNHGPQMTMNLLDFNEHAPLYWKLIPPVTSELCNYTYGVTEPQGISTYVVPRSEPTVIREAFFERIISTYLPYCGTVRWYKGGNKHRFGRIHCDDKRIVYELGSREIRVFEMT